MKGTQPGDTPSKDREAQNILKTVGRFHKSLGVEGVDGTQPWASLPASLLGEEK